jgi:hypothetical protein
MEGLSQNDQIIALLVQQTQLLQSLGNEVYRLRTGDQTPTPSRQV